MDLCQSLLCRMLSRFVIDLLPRSKCLLISWLKSLSTLILEPKKIEPDITSTFPPFVSPFYEVMELDNMVKKLR